jgi:hypothetical protein
VFSFLLQSTLAPNKVKVDDKDLRKRIVHQVPVLVTFFLGHLSSKRYYVSWSKVSWLNVFADSQWNSTY